MNLRTIALPFDWIRINIDDLINILETDFQFFLDELFIESESNKFSLIDLIEIKNYDIFNSVGIKNSFELDKTLIIKSRKYLSLVFPHEIKDINDFPIFIEKYKKRINNFRNIINDSKINKIFIRVEKNLSSKLDKLDKLSNLCKPNQIKYVNIDKSIKYSSWKKDEIDWKNIFN
jgi:hypothetical protein